MRVGEGERLRALVEGTDLAQIGTNRASNGSDASGTTIRRSEETAT
jgi:hypothetical protein